MESNKNIVESVKTLIAQGQLEQVISFMSTLDVDNDLRNDIILLSGRHAKLESDNSKGLLSSSEYNIRTNNIMKSVFVILDEIENKQPRDKQLPNILSRIWSFFTGNTEKEAIKEAAISRNERRAKEEDLWNQTTSRDTIGSYLTFIKSFPKSPLIKDAKKRMAEIEEENLWKKASTENTIESYSAYLKKYKKGVFTENAKKRIQEIEEKESWEKAISKHTVIAFKEYIDKFPNGVFVLEATHFIKDLEEQLMKINEIRNIPIKPTPENGKGNNYILAIGIDSYSYVPMLHSCVRDVKGIVEILTTDYTFDQENITTLFNEDATRRNIIQKFELHLRILREIDNLVIIFAGHGIQKENKGYWVPVDSQFELHEYISIDEIKRYLSAVNARHILVLADSNYQESFIYRQGLSKKHDYNDDLSRYALVSGNGVVSDGSLRSHTPFAHSIINFLKSNDKPSLDIVELCNNVIAYNQTQRPLFGTIEGHQGGRYFLHKRQAQNILDDSENDEAIDLPEDLDKIKSFGENIIRQIWHKKELWFNVVDIVGILTDSPDPKRYNATLSRREPQLKTLSKYIRRRDTETGKYVSRRYANTEGVLRLIMSIPSPKAEPLKLWLAQTRKEALEEEENKLYTLVLRTTTNNGNRNKNSVDYLEHWHTKYGNGHFHLAALAAFPLHLTADLLYKIWQNFKNTEGVNIPRVAVSDLLLSGLLHEVSTELFEYAPDLRRNLLQALQEYYGERKILEELGAFMLDYLATHYAEGVAYTEPIREAEEWNALAYHDPAQANAKLAAALNPLAANNYQTRQLRAVFVAEKLEAQSFRTIEDPSVQRSFERILTFSKGMKRYIQGDLGKAYEQLVQLPDFRIQGDNEGFTEGVAALELPKGVVVVPTIVEDTPNNKNSLWWCAFGNVSSKVIEQDVEKILENINLDNYDLSAVSIETSQSLIHFLEEDDDKGIMNDTDVFLIYYRSRNQAFDTTVFQKTKFVRNYVVISDAPYPNLIEFAENDHDKIPNLIWIQSTDLVESPFFFNRIGLFTQKLVDVIQNAEKSLTYSELFSRIYTKVTQQTDKQHPQIQAFGNANLQDLFLNGMLKTQNTEVVSLPKMQVGFGSKVEENFKKEVLEVFEKEGKSLFFDLIDTIQQADYLIQFEPEQKIYTLESTVGEPLMFPTIPFEKFNKYQLITLFNNIDRVANWHYTLGISSNPSISFDHDKVGIEFYNLGIEDDKDVAPSDWHQPIEVEVVKDKKTSIRLSIENNSNKPLWVSIVYLGKDFAVRNDLFQTKLLQVGEIEWIGIERKDKLTVSPSQTDFLAMVERETSKHAVQMFIGDKYLQQGKTSITEFFKIFVSSERFSTDALNRDSLSTEEEAKRDLVTRSHYQSSKRLFQNMVIKTVVMTLKLKEAEKADLQEVIEEPQKKLTKEDEITLVLKNAVTDLSFRLFLKRYGVDRNDIDDIIQSSIVAAFELLHKMDDKAFSSINPKMYLYAIARNKLLASRRKHIRDLKEDLVGDSIKDFHNYGTEDSYEMERIEDEKILIDRVNQIRGIVSEEDFSLLIEWAINGKSYQKLADELGLTVLQVKNKVAKLRNRIRELLGDETLGGF
jgi:RNA polymerase sigma factor (sigma-70 family)